MRLLAVSGSLRAGSYNTALARAAADLAPAGVDVKLFDDLGDLPLFDADLEGTEPESVVELRKRISGVDALLIVTPEYNGSIPGALKNAIDWASRPRESAALRGKTVAVAGASTGQYGALLAIQDLRRILGVAGARVIAGEVSVPRAHELVNRAGAFSSELVESRLSELLSALAAEAAPLTLAA